MHSTSKKAYLQRPSPEKKKKKRGGGGGGKWRLCMASFTGTSLHPGLQAPETHPQPKHPLSLSEVDTFLRAL